MNTKPVIKRLKPSSRIQCTVTFQNEEVRVVEDAVIKERGRSIAIDGFRPGQAPPERVREHIGEDRILDDIVRHLLSRTLPHVLKENNILPIIPPVISITSLDPLTLILIFIEHPDVTVKKIDEIEKSEPKVSEERYERRRREHALLEKIRKATVVDLAPELIAEEVRLFKEEMAGELARANITYDEWLKRGNNSKEEMEAEFTSQAENRLKIRFGLEKLIEEKNVNVTEEEIKRIVSDAGKGDGRFERAKWQIRVKKVMDDLLG